MDLANSFLNSSEFQARYGNNLTNNAFVSQIYTNVLGRAPDASGLAYWTGNLDTGTSSRAVTLAAISESPENVARTAGSVASGLWVESETAASVARLYDTTFARLPDASGLQYWLKSIAAGTDTISTVAAHFVVSPEFVAKYGTLDNMGFVKALYTNTLHRPGDGTGVAYWVNSLAQGATRANIVLNFSESLEHQTNTAENVISNNPANYGVRVQ